MPCSPCIIDGGILAGGLARRMNGLDKGLQLFQDKSMAYWVAKALAPQVRNVVINCNRHLSEYKKISPFIVTDTLAGYPGPLAGILSLLEFSDADYLLISPCDTPLLDSGFSTLMLDHLSQALMANSNKPPLFAAKVGEKYQPLHLCIAKEYKTSISNFLKSGNQRVMQWMEENEVHWLEFPDNDPSFKNMNTLDDIQNA